MLLPKLSSFIKKETMLTQILLNKLDPITLVRHIDWLYHREGFPTYLRC